MDPNTEPAPALSFFFYMVSLVPCRWFVTLSECCDETRAE
jgi:hypothetical protein